VSSSQKRAATRELQGRFGVSERRACAVLDQPRSTQRYWPQTRSDEAALCRRLRELVRRRPRFGYRRLTAMLKREGWIVNAKRVQRLCRKEGLKVRRKPRKRRALGSSQNACHVRRAERKDQVWCWDFAFDRTRSGTTLKWLSIVDERTRECLALKVSRSITSEDVIDTLAELFAMRGVPECVRSDNGPEFVSQAIQAWLSKLSINALYIAPGSPWENGYAESFHSKLVDEFLSREEFESVREARQLTSAWREDYNEHRPHSSLGYLTPREYAARCIINDRATDRCAASAPALDGPALQPPGDLPQPILS
jgi:putative transposase